MKNIESFESAAQHLGIDPTKLPDVSMLPEASQKAVVAFYKISIISQASWDGITIDWYNWHQGKYYPWFDMSVEKVGSSSGFSFLGYNYDSSGSYVGSRLVYPSSEVAKYVGKTHIELYRDLMVID